MEWEDRQERDITVQHKGKWNGKEGPVIENSDS